MDITVRVTVEAPDGATHYDGNLLGKPTFYKMTMVGVVGEHWWFYNGGQWRLSQHSKPHWVKPLLPEMSEVMP